MSIKRDSGNVIAQATALFYQRTLPRKINTIKRQNGATWTRSKILLDPVCHRFKALLD